MFALLMRIITIGRAQSKIKVLVLIQFKTENKKVFRIEPSQRNAVYFCF